MQQASEMGVEIMSVEKLLDFVGFDGEKRVIPLGRDARSEDFRAAPDDGVLRRSTGNVFTESDASSRRSAY